MKKIQWLAVVGVLLIISGRLLGLHMPIIKKIWTSSMTLYSSGFCFLLMALFYYLIDYKGFGKYFNWLKIYGMNSILAYMLFEIINFDGISTSLLHGIKQFSGSYYEALIKLSNGAIIFSILWLMYREKKFLKV